MPLNPNIIMQVGQGVTPIKQRDPMRERLFEQNQEDRRRNHLREDLADANAQTDRGYKDDERKQAESMRAAEQDYGLLNSGGQDPIAQRNAYAKWWGNKQDSGADPSQVPGAVDPTQWTPEVTGAVKDFIKTKVLGVKGVAAEQRADATATATADYRRSTLDQGNERNRIAARRAAGRGPDGETFSARSILFENGSAVLYSNSGKRRVVGPNGEVYTGAEAARIVKEGRLSGIIDQGDRSEARKKGEGRGSRTDLWITEGVDSAQGAAMLYRAKGLLGELSTGGFDAVRVKAKQWLGIESANEAELSSALGKAVLQKLRATFGAAFTEKEGAKLERIEAGFGKSTEGNKRLIDQTLQLVIRSAERGIRTAERHGDYEAAEEIQKLLDSRLSDTLEEGQPGGPPAKRIRFDAQGNPIQ